MLCQHCQKRVATVHFTQIVNNKKTEMFLCEQCANGKSQIHVGSPISLNDFLTGLIGGTNAGTTRSVAPQQIVCEKCGMNYKEFQSTGKFGCFNCYEVFGDRLNPLLKRLHGNIRHNGKVPEKVSKSIRSSKEISELKEILNKAIQDEEYEKAAEIRDKIRSIETQG